MKPTFCRLALPSTQLPMPDQGGRLFSARGETVDLESPFWARCLADGDIVVATEPGEASDAAAVHARQDDDAKAKRK